MAQRETPEQALQRWNNLHLLQDAYPTFVPFLRDMLAELGFSTAKILEEIAEFLENGPAYLMIQAQRGQAKTTCAAIYAVWWLIHHPQDLQGGRPAARVLIVSAGGTQANEISTLIVRLIMSVDLLECLRPDKSNGDRTSVEHFDIHYTLKGVDKSPSVACVGITSNLQGKRADLLIADDVESLKNSMTAIQRAQLLNVTRDFTSINSDGRIVYLGTPQSIDSIYNTLPSRGFAVRIWPGRVPNDAQLKHYGEALAPSIRALAEKHPEYQSGFGPDGKQGRAIDARLNEDVLSAKELDQGPAYFQLQHMLLTALTDAQRYPLKTENLVVMRLKGDRFPVTVTRGYGGTALVTRAIGTKKYLLSLPHEVSNDTAKLQAKTMYIDPAGGGMNADESAFAVGGLLNSNIYLMAWGGVHGGYHLDNLTRMAQHVLDNEPTTVIIEKNYGHGAYKEIFTPVLVKLYESVGKKPPAILDDLVTGQKEQRIINTLEPVIGRGSLIVDDDAIADEELGLQSYDLRVRETYSLLFQLSKITRDKNSLFHDDRLDAVEGLVRSFLPALAVEQNKAIKAARDAELQAFIANPLGFPASALRAKPTVSGAAARMRRL